MGDLISRAAALEVINAVNGVTWSQSGKVLCGKMYSQIKDLPAVDAAPVKHGKWLGWRHHWAWLVCDQCNEKMLVRKDNHGYIQEFPHNYCPNCGARMGGDTE